VRSETASRSKPAPSPSGPSSPNGLTGPRAPKVVIGGRDPDAAARSAPKGAAIVQGAASRAWVATVVQGAVSRDRAADRRARAGKEARA